MNTKKMAAREVAPGNPSAATSDDTMTLDYGEEGSAGAALDYPVTTAEPASVTVEDLATEGDLPITVFFTPSGQLASRIVAHNQRLLSLDYESEAPDLDDVNDEDEQEVDEEPPWANNSESETNQQRLIGERLYHYLAFLARQSSNEDGGKLEALRKGLIAMLGLSAVGRPGAARDSERLVGALVDEFLAWLSDSCFGAYVTPWGEVYLTDGELVLSAYTFDDESSSEPYEPATYLPPPSKAGKSVGQG